MDRSERSPLEEFVALVAHEVRTPLSIARSAADTVLDIDDPGSAPEQLDQLLEMINRNLDLAMLLLDRLSLARSIEAEDVDLSTEVCDLGELVAQSMSDLRHSVLGGRPVESYLAEDLSVEVDPTAVREIVFNLLSNAAKYSSEDATIEVTLAPHDERWARLVVRNHGGGVTPGDTEQIFEKFFQGDPGSSGVGLGLFISRGLARAHDGRLNVRPAADEGSEFVLDLPRHRNGTT